MRAHGDNYDDDNDEEADFALRCVCVRTLRIRNSQRLLPAHATARVAFKFMRPLEAAASVAR